MKKHVPKNIFAGSGIIDAKREPFKIILEAVVDIFPDPAHEKIVCIKANIGFVGFALVKLKGLEKADHHFSVLRCGNFRPPQIPGPGESYKIYDFFLHHGMREHLFDENASNPHLPPIAGNLYRLDLHHHLGFESGPPLIGFRIGKHPETDDVFFIGHRKDHVCVLFGSPSYETCTPGVERPEIGVFAELSLETELPDLIGRSKIIHG